MSNRRFSDGQRKRWEVQVTSKSEWQFKPIGGNNASARRVRPPLYAGDDPFELSEQELQKILGDSTIQPMSSKPSPFGDDYVPPKKKSLFLDDL